jgi:filamentous hemagglutinin
MYSDRVELKGLAQNRPLQDLTHQEMLGIFGTAGIDLSNHAITRLKDSRTKNIGFETPNDIAKIFNDGTKFDAGNGAVGYGYKGLEVIINPATKKVVTFRPAKNRE